MTTRSSVLARDTNKPYNWAFLASPPVGYAWIVKTINVTNDGSVAATVQIRVSQRVGPAYVDWITESVPAHSNVIYQAWTVVEDVDMIYWLPETASVSIWVSGTELPVSPSIPGQGPPPLGVHDWLLQPTAKPS